MNEFIFRDSQVAFNNAIALGMDNPQDYMYMYSDETHDYFKTIMTREYKKYPYNI